jgi:putative membrane-bound dehydrogenase-like protein
MVVNPTNIDVDSRGRVWVCEGLNYRLTRRGNQRFHRVEEADKIKILDDTDGDGKADKVTVFADRVFPVPMGIAVEERYGTDGKYKGCRVFIGNSPDLLVLEDTDGDDRADKRYALLAGFGGVDSDHGVHGMVLGLDGKLYFTQGDGCCSVQQDHSERQQNFDVVDKSGRRVSSDQLANTLRVNRDGTQFEVICDRQRNNYETCLNSFGTIFTSDNDDDGNRGCRVIWAMDGGHYGYKTPGSPRHWGEDVPGTIPKLVGTGNGSPCGIMVYEGELLPESYRGAVLEVDAGTRQVNAFPISRHGAAFRTEYQVFLSSDDPWFRPVDACAAPDGSVFVADWYDAGVGGHAFSDQTTGRIYRVAPAGRKIPGTKPDFGTIDGLIAALKSPNVATQDAARRLLIERGKEPEVVGQVGTLAVHDKDPIYRARAYWVWHALEGDAIAMAALLPAISAGAPGIREMAVRMLGRDCRDNGHVVYQKPEARQAPAALRHLDVLTAAAADSDAGVRREVILALRNLPTDKAGDALRTLAASWDGQDRWYLEALGLALEKRESSFLAGLFDGSLYGDLDLERAGRNGKVALPPYFPIDRNEAFIPSTASDLPATAVSKYLGLAWRLHRSEVLPLVERIIPHLQAPELQQAGDDVLEQLKEPQTAERIGALALRVDDPARRLSLYRTLARKLGREWSAARDRPQVIRAIERALGDPGTRVQGLAMAAATHDQRYRATFEKLAEDSRADVEERVAAVEALGSLPRTSRAILERLIAGVQAKPSSNPVAEAAVRVAARLPDGPARLVELLTARDYPLGLRRAALRSLAQRQDGGTRVLNLARAGKIPGDLKTEATTLLYTSPERRVREAAAQLLPPPTLADGRPLPPIGELIRREGDPARGRDVFFRAGTSSCGSCHRVQGRGQWVGPDLSTIGVKYGRDELIRSILSPSAAIGYNFRPVVAALADGRVITGLAVEDTPDRLVLKTATGERVAIPASSIEERGTMDVSLMPEGLAQTLSEQDLVDLIVYLATLRQPAGIVGQYHVLGPLEESALAPRINPSAVIDLDATVDAGHGHRLSWRRQNANAEGLLDLAAPASGNANRAAAVYVCTPVLSPAAQRARLVVDTPAEVTAWLSGKPVALSARDQNSGEPRTGLIDLPHGSSTLLLRLTSRGADAAQPLLVTTIVADQPVGFTAAVAGR